MNNLLSSIVILTFFSFVPSFPHASADDSHPPPQRARRDRGDITLGLTELALLTPGRHVAFDPYGFFGIFAGYKFVPDQELQLFWGATDLFNYDQAFGASYRYFLMPEKMFSPLFSVGFAHDSYTYRAKASSEYRYHTAEWLSLGMALNCAFEMGIVLELGVRVHTHTKRTYDEDGKEFSNHISVYPQASYRF